MSGYNLPLIPYMDLAPWFAEEKEDWLYCTWCGGEIYEGEEAYQAGSREFYCISCVGKTDYKGEDFPNLVKVTWKDIDSCLL